MRTAIQFQIRGVNLQGTYHSQADRALCRMGGKKVGILFSNAGYQPRSSQGDLAAHLADHLSELGFHSFRFDMPGVGDSEGELPIEVLPFYDLVQNGGHVEFINELKTVLMTKWGLSGMIYLGHCGSSTTAVYAAVQYPSDDLLGMILLDPSFIWYRALEPAAVKTRMDFFFYANERLAQLRRSIRAWLVQRPGGEALTVNYGKLEILFRRLLGRAKIPQDSNTRLLDCYRIQLSKGIPILMLTAAPVEKRSNYFDYAGWLHSEHESRVLTVVNISGAGHSFLEGNGKLVTFSTIETWLRRHFSDTSIATPAVESA